jgi:hypothetical protein
VATLWRFESSSGHQVYLSGSDKSQPDTQKNPDFSYDNSPQLRIANVACAVQSTRGLRRPSAHAACVPDAYLEFPIRINLCNINIVRRHILGGLRASSIVEQ